MERHIEEFKKWINNDKIRSDEHTLEILEEMRWDMDAIKQFFSTDLEFGTSGLRGLIGVGTNRLNTYTVKKISQGLAGYINDIDKDPLVVIAYDSRYMSREFAESSAGVFAGNGIPVYMFSEHTPVPVLSYATRELGATAGIAITANCNSKEYNGYKVYNSQGYQLTEKESAKVKGYIDKLDIFKDINEMTYDDSLEFSLTSYVPDNIYEGYINAVKKAATSRQKFFKRIEHDFRADKYVYTPLFGSGYRYVKELCPDIKIAETQIEHDGDFPGLKYPDPEKEEAFEEAVKIADETGADVILATDPDACRFGMAVRTGEGFKVLNGNEIGTLLLRYLCDTKRIPFDGIVMRSMVGTPLVDDILKKYPLAMRVTVPGFEHIGEALANKTDPKKFFFGFEESNGFLYGSYAMEMDGIAALYLTVAMLNAYGNPLEKLEEISEKSGRWYYICHEYKGEALLMDSLRAEPLKGSIITDYKDGIDEIPPADILKICYEDGSYAFIRPSGTGPKIKIYIYSHTQEMAEHILEAVNSRLVTLEGGSVEQESDPERINEG